MAKGNSLKKEMNRLADIVFQRELDTELTKINADFKKWEKGTINSFQLNDLIHKYHEDVSQHLWKLYQQQPEFLVARALANNTIKNEETNPIILKALKDKMAFFKIDKNV